MGTERGPWAAPPAPSASQRLPAPCAPADRAAAPLIARLLIPAPRPLPGVALTAPSPSDRGLGGRPALAQKAPTKWGSAQLTDNTFYKKKNYRRQIVELSPRACLYLKNQNFLGDVGQEGAAPGGLL